MYAPVPTHDRRVTLDAKTVSDVLRSVSRGYGGDDVHRMRVVSDEDSEEETITRELRHATLTFVPILACATLGTLFLWLIVRLL